ncbi:MAG: universal stress protein [Saprospiraceae bacterium]|nr:MAG: universal stress protein [Saprospiraceae bacterium]
MKKILFPTDLSPHAKTVFEYALVLAKKMNASITVFSAHGRPNIALEDIEVQEERSETVIKNLRKFVTDHLPDSYDDIEFQYEARIAYPGEGIAKAAEELKPELIVMGMRDRTNDIGARFGSSAFDTIRDVDCPVLAIPPGTDFVPIKNLVYAVDFEFEDLPVINHLLDWSQQFQTDTHILHVFEKNEHKTIVQDKMAVLSGVYFDNPRLSFEIRGGKFQEVIDEFLEEKDAGVLVMLSHRRRFLERVIFPSQTVKVARKLNLPLLVFKARYN